MCTLTFAWNVFSRTPLALVANRDERPDRPSHPPRAIGDDPTVVAPQDAEAGGTWIGVNEHGLVVSITNGRAGLDGRRSRGLLVRDALDCSSAAAAATFVREAVREDDYASFNLLLADAELACYCTWDGEFTEHDFEPGAHVIANAGYDDGAEKSRRIRKMIAVRDDEDAAAWLDRTAGVLADHEHGTCLHREQFGTVSASMIQIADDGRVRFHYADGPPCRTPFEPVDLPSTFLEGQV